MNSETEMQIIKKDTHSTDDINTRAFHSIFYCISVYKIKKKNKKSTII